MRFSSALVAVASLALFSSTSNAQTQKCNGYAELCAKAYDKVTYATTHNAYSVDNSKIAANQINDIPTQLKDGIRALMLDGYPANVTTDIELCHTSCSLLDAGPLSTILKQVKAFLDANPNDVVTIFWENAGNLSPTLYQTVYNAAGLANYVYTQPAGTAWPTLATMIASGKRLVNFIDNGALASVPWLMAEYSHAFETPFAIPAGGPYLCTIDRPAGGAQQSLYVLNHFTSAELTIAGTQVSIPQKGSAATTNGVDLASHINLCQSTFSQNPAYVAVDFYQQGSLLSLVAQLNGVTWNGILPTNAGLSTNPKSTGGNAAGSSTSTAAAPLGRKDAVVGLTVAAMVFVATLLV